ncbi:hypothetical protein CW304_18890 [Bacillus sp. UFRGS-B20]|nr:hypothetical protein CW304_18890 [Bacillus sp. UFRGS-B20]
MADFFDLRKSIVRMLLILFHFYTMFIELVHREFLFESSGVLLLLKFFTKNEERIHQLLYKISLLNTV